MKRLALIPLATLALTGPAIADVNRMDGGGFSWNLPYTTEAGDPAQRVRDNGPGRCPNGVLITFPDGDKRLRWYYPNYGLSCQRDAPKLVNVDPYDALPRVQVVDTSGFKRFDPVPLADGTQARFLSASDQRIQGQVKISLTYGEYWQLAQWKPDGTAIPSRHNKPVADIDMGKVPTREVVKR